MLTVSAMVAEEQPQHDERRRLESRAFGDRFRLPASDGDREQNGRYEPIHQRRQEQREEFRELDLASLPDHQRGDVAERTERTTRIGGDHDIDASDGDKARMAAADRQDHGAQQQRGGEVVGDRRDHERQRAGRPEQRAQRQTALDQPHPQRVEQTAIVQRVDERHRGNQEQQQLCEVENRVARSIGRRGLAPCCAKATPTRIQISPAATSTGTDLRTCSRSSDMATP